MQFNFVGMCKLYFVFICFEVHARWINVNKFYDSLTKTLPRSRECVYIYDNSLNWGSIADHKELT